MINMGQHPDEVSLKAARLQAALWATIPRPDFTVEAQIRVKTSAEVAYDWVDHLTAALGDDVRARQAGLPASRKAAAVKPGAMYGEIAVTRFPNGRYVPSKLRTLSDDGLRWLRRELVDMPHSVWVSVGPLGDDGIVNAGPVALEIAPRRSPGWLRLSAYVRESAFADPATQQRWLDAVLEFADRVSPGYGQIGYCRGGNETAVEQTTNPRTADATRRRPDYAIDPSRRTQRGYDWLTVIPQELANALGGADALAATGAFAQVRPLAQGGIAVLANATFQDYDLATAEPVFRALAPILPPGRPFLIPEPPHVPPVFVIDQDPAQR
jgi:hypothetical protein